jgi:hypothetical protein
MGDGEVSQGVSDPSQSLRGKERASDFAMSSPYEMLKDDCNISSNVSSFWLEMDRNRISKLKNRPLQLKDRCLFQALSFPAAFSLPRP